MKRARDVLIRLLYPPLWAAIAVPVVSFAALIAVFVRGEDESALAYIVYGMSAYSLAVWVAAVPGLTKRTKSAIMESGVAERAAASPVIARYMRDRAFRGSVGVYQGMAVNFFYVVFRVAAGIRFASVWFISMAVYYLALGGLRLYLILCYRRRTPSLERRCYRNTAWLLFALNIPMGGMIAQMALNGSGYSYPGYMIYLSALYTFYAMIMSVVNLVKFRALGSPILSAAKALNVISAMMSILGLQTAMISRFSPNDMAYRRMMNAITGGFVYGGVIVIAVYMLMRSRKGGRRSVE